MSRDRKERLPLLTERSSARRGCREAIDRRIQPGRGWVGIYKKMFAKEGIVSDMFDKPDPEVLQVVERAGESVKFKADSCRPNRVTWEVYNGIRCFFKDTHGLGAP
jgi:hypothetical protein